MKKRRWSAEEKRRIVEATLVAGATVAQVAESHGVGSSLVYVWRKRYRDGGQAAGGVQAVKLLPVAVGGEQPAIEIELAKGRVRLAGADGSLLRAVLEMLQ
ncbi:MAG: transposase [Acidobacteriia bacterium]|nr:transposase [Terriglobia bacterium]